jgi:glycosyltransferase involved in cell wall biosynthesis
VAQDGDHEVLVVDDGSADGSADAVAARFPSVRVERSERSLGVIMQRNRGVELASSDLIVSVDDDVVFESGRTVDQTVADFDHSRVGAVAIPFIDARAGREVLQRAPTDDSVWVASGFVGCACAVRRGPFLAAGGYRRALGQYWEEPDLALRLLDRGWFTRLGRADPILHLESARRVRGEKIMLGRRNGILCACLTAPWPSLPAHLAWLTANNAYSAVTEGPALPMLRGTLAGFRDGIRLRGDRAPVSRTTFRLRQRLWRTGAKRLEALSSELPPAWR